MLTRSLHTIGAADCAEARAAKGLATVCEAYNTVRLQHSRQRL
jgi:hypothetical protein